MQRGVVKLPVDMPRDHICTLNDPSSRTKNTAQYGDLQAISHNTFVGNSLLPSVERETSRGRDVIAGKHRLHR